VFVFRIVSKVSMPSGNTDTTTSGAQSLLMRYLNIAWPSLPRSGTKTIRECGVDEIWIAVLDGSLINDTLLPVRRFRKNIEMASQISVTP